MNTEPFSFDGPNSMSVADLIRKFDVRKDIPVDVNDVKAELIVRGVRDVIWFCCVELDAEILRGQLVHWKQKDEAPINDVGPDAFRGVADIYYAETLTLDWRRIVCCKELLHIIDPANAQTSTHEGVLKLTERIALPPDLQGIDDGSAALIDRVGMLQATAVLFPRKARDIFVANGTLSNAEIAALVDLPERYVALVMSDAWPDIHAILLTL